MPLPIVGHRIRFRYSDGHLLSGTRRGRDAGSRRVRRQEQTKRRLAAWGSAQWTMDQSGYLRSLEGKSYAGLGWFLMGLQLLIMLNRKLYILIIYMVLGPLASWAPGRRTACPHLRAGPDFFQIKKTVQPKEHRTQPHHT